MRTQIFNALTKSSTVAANTLTDPGVLFSLGNTILNLFTGGGQEGLVFNVASLVICTGLRFQAEIKKSSNQNTGPRMILDDPRTSLAVAAVAQLGVASATAILAPTFAGVAIPTCFGIGNFFAAGYFSSPQGQGKKRSFLGRVFLKPDVYYASGLALAGGAAGAYLLPAYVAGVASSLYHAQKDKKPPLAFEPLVVYTGALAASSASNARADYPGHESVATTLGLFASGYISILCQAKGGVVEALHDLRVRSRLSNKIT